MKFVGMLIYLYAILEIVLTIKIQRRRNDESPLDILRKLQLFRSKKAFLKSEMKNQKDPKKWGEMDKDLNATREMLKSLRLKFNIKEQLAV